MDAERWPAVVDEVDVHGVGRGPLTHRVEVKLVTNLRLETLGTDINPPLRTAQGRPFDTTKLLPPVPHPNLKPRGSDCKLRLLTDWELDPT